MNLIQIEVMDERLGRPSGNPFTVSFPDSISVVNQVFTLQFGMNLVFDESLRLDAECVSSKDLFVVGVKDARPVTLVAVWSGVFPKGLVVNSCQFLFSFRKTELEAVRFVEWRGQKRVICGDPQRTD